MGLISRVGAVGMLSVALAAAPAAGAWATPGTAAPGGPGTVAPGGPGTAPGGTTTPGARGGTVAPGGTGTATPKRTVAEVQQRVRAKHERLVRKMAVVRPRIAANSRLSPAERRVLDEDIARLLAASTAAQRQVAAATTMDQIRAARPALDRVVAARKKFQADWAAAHRDH